MPTASTPSPLRCLFVSHDRSEPPLEIVISVDSNRVAADPAVLVPTLLRDILNARPTSSFRPSAVVATLERWYASGSDGGGGATSGWNNVAAFPLANETTCKGELPLILYRKGAREQIPENTRANNLLSLFKSRLVPPHQNNLPSLQGDVFIFWRRDSSSQMMLLSDFTSPDLSRLLSAANFPDEIDWLSSRRPVSTGIFGTDASDLVEVTPPPTFPAPRPELFGGKIGELSRSEVDAAAMVVRLFFEQLKKSLIPVQANLQTVLAAACRPSKESDEIQRYRSALEEAHMRHNKLHTELQQLRLVATRLTEEHEALRTDHRHVLSEISKTIPSLLSTLTSSLHFKNYIAELEVTAPGLARINAGQRVAKTEDAPVTDRPSTTETARPEPRATDEPRRVAYRVTQTYTPESPSADSFANLHVGDLVIAEREDSSGWWWVVSEKTMVEGWFPFSYLEPCDPTT